MRLKQVINKLLPVTAAALVLGACASAPTTPETVAAEPVAGEDVAAKKTVPEGEVKVVQTTAQAAKYLTKEELREARRACMRKARKITGSRIPRNACQGSAGMYAPGTHVRGAEQPASTSPF